MPEPTNMPHELAAAALDVLSGWSVDEDLASDKVSELEHRFAAVLQEPLSSTQRSMIDSFLYHSRFVEKTYIDIVATFDRQDQRLLSAQEYAKQLDARRLPDRSTLIDFWVAVVTHLSKCR